MDDLALSSFHVNSASILNCSSWTEIFSCLEAAVASTAATTAAQRRRLRWPSHLSPVALHLHADLQRAQDDGRADNAFDIGKRLCRARREHARERAALRALSDCGADSACRSRKVIKATLHGPDGPLPRDRWCEPVGDYIASRFHREEADANQRLLDVALSEVRAKCLDGVDCVDVPLQFTLDVLAGAGRNSAGSDDNFVWEILQALPFHVVAFFHECFWAQINSLEPWCQPIESWLFFLIPKGGEELRSISGWRPLGVLSVIQKWFCGVLSMVRDGWSSYRMVQLGFHADRQPLEATEPLRLALQVARESCLNLFALSGDVKQAFDMYSWQLLDKAARQEGQTPELRAASLRELVGSSCKVSLAGHTLEEQFLVQNGGRQGNTNSPADWNRVLEFFLGPVAVSYTELGFGIPTASPGVRFTHTAFADNIWWIASSLKMLLSMFVMASRALWAERLDWKPSSLELLIGCETSWSAEAGAALDFSWFFLDVSGARTVCAVAARTCVLTVDDRDLAISLVPKMKALGTWLTPDGEQDETLAHRALCASRAVVAQRRHYRSRHVPLHRRAGKLLLREGNTLLWGSQGLSFRKSTCDFISRLEMKWLRNIQRTRKLPEEEWTHYWRRTAKVARAAVKCANAVPLLRLALGRKWSWSGHAARVSAEANSPICHVLDWRSRDWWRTWRAEHAVARLPALGRRLRRGRPSHIWEHDLVRDAGLDCKSAAKDRLGWRSGLSGFVERNLRRVGCRWPRASPAAAVVGAAQLHALPTAAIRNDVLAGAGGPSQRGATAAGAPLCGAGSAVHSAEEAGSRWRPERGFSLALPARFSEKLRFALPAWPILIEGDSTWVRDVILGRARTRQPSLRWAAQQVQQALLHFNVAWHARAYNAEADALARTAVQDRSSRTDVGLCGIPPEPTGTALSPVDVPFICVCYDGSAVPGTGPGAGANSNVRGGRPPVCCGAGGRRYSSGAGAILCIQFRGTTTIWAAASRFLGSSSGNNSAEVSTCFLATELLAELCAARLSRLCDAS